LLYFIGVAKHEHVSHAAETLHIAQSAVSRQIANLEAELGVQLLEKEGRNIKLTHIGKLFAEQASIAIKAIDNAKQMIDEYLDPDKGTIRIGFPSSFASNILPSIITAFKKHYPDIRFHLRQGSYTFLIEAVKNREIDLAFIGLFADQCPGGLVHQLLVDEPLVAVVAAHHPLAGRPAVELDELAAVSPFIEMRAEAGLRLQPLEAAGS